MHRYGPRVPPTSGRRRRPDPSSPLSPDRLLEGLDDSQRRAVTSAGAPLAILAGPGSGKTRVLTRRIAWQAATGRLAPEHVLAITFTRRASRELRERLVTLGVAGAVTSGTLHSVALAQLTARKRELGHSVPAVLGHKAGLLAPLVGGPGPEAEAAADELAGEIEWAKARLIGPDAYALAAGRAGRAPALPLDEVAALYTRYEIERRRRGLIDFDDIVWQCADAFDHDPEFAASRRWSYRHLFVDEFQDTSPAQLRLITGWLGGRDDLTVVGDPDQSIFACSGADPSHLSGFTNFFSGATVLHLEHNHRCPPRVITVASALLADGERGPRATASPTTATSPAVPTITCYDTDEEEATAVARRARATHGPHRPWSQVAILYRTNAQAVLLQRGLEREGVPFRVRRADPPLGDGPRSPGDDVDAVELLTFHRAKGLEFETVIVTGLERGLVPIAHAKSRAERAEERRLVYVALTRARHELHLTWSRRRTLGTRAVPRSPSPWLAPIAAALGTTFGGGQVAEEMPPAARIRGMRARLAHGSEATAPSELLGALVEWRRNLARASGVPAFVILHDATLKAVVDAEPRDRVALLRIPGIGPVKAQRHGDAVLELVNRHAS